MQQSQAGQRGPRGRSPGQPPALKGRWCPALSAPAAWLASAVPTKPASPRLAGSTVNSNSILFLFIIFKRSRPCGDGRLSSRCDRQRGRAESPQQVLVAQQPLHTHMTHLCIYTCTHTHAHNLHTHSHDMPLHMDMRSHTCTRLTHMTRLCIRTCVHRHTHLYTHAHNSHMHKCLHTCTRHTFAHALT